MSQGIDWSVFDKEYPVVDGIVNALPDDLNYFIQPDQEATHQSDVHGYVYEATGSPSQGQLLADPKLMAKIQKDFYDKVAVGFQKMDDDPKSIFDWKIERQTKYDARFFKGKKLLFIGAGNCRYARRYAQMGFDVIATDVSPNFLAVGKKRNEELGIKMTYVAHDAERKFPFKTGSFSDVYSLCVMNHIDNWSNYVTEKLRCIEEGGHYLERMPNATLYSFWSWNDLSYGINGIEVKAQHCYPDAVTVLLQQLGLKAVIWTHDRQTEMDFFNGKHYRLMHFIQKFGGNYLRWSRRVYNFRNWREDMRYSHDFIKEVYNNRDGSVQANRNGIYTMFFMVKDKGKR